MPKTSRRMCPKRLKNDHNIKKRSEQQGHFPFIHKKNGNGHALKTVDHA